MGRKWQQRIDDADEVQEAADDLWNESKFDEPLDNVIRFGHRYAALQAVAVAASVLRKNSEYLKRYIEGRLGAQNVAPKDLRPLIEDTINKLNQLRQMHRETIIDLEKNFAATRSSIQDDAKQTGEKAKEQFKKLLKDGAIDLASIFRPEIKAIVESQEWRNEYSIVNIESMVGQLVHLLPKDIGSCNVLMNAVKKVKHFPTFDAMAKFFRSEEGSLWNVNLTMIMAWRARNKSFLDALEKNRGKEDKELVFASQEDANGILENIFHHAIELLNKAEKSILETVFKNTDSLKKQLMDKRNDIEQRTSDLSEKLKDVNLDVLIFEVPQYSYERHDFLLEANHAPLVGEKTESRVVYKEQDGAWAGIKRTIDFFHARWGYDEEKVDEKYYMLDMREVESHWEKILADSLENLKDKVENEILQPLKHSCDDFFIRVQSCFEQAQKIMQKGLDDQLADQLRQEQSQERFLAIRHELKNLQQQFGTSDEDAETLDKWASRQSENHAASLQ